MSKENGPKDPCGDDRDGLIDCADEGSAGCSPQLVYPTAYGEIKDPYDNDGDVLTDYLDEDCLQSVFEMHETSCTDCVDNDGDGYIDCDDVSCSEPPAYGATPTPELKPILGRILGIQPPPLPDEAIVHEIDESNIISVDPELPADIQEEVTTSCEELSVRCKSVVGPQCSTESDQKCKPGECGEDKLKTCKPDTEDCH